LTLTWAGVPPAFITPPSAINVSLNTQNDAVGTASISTTEIDYYSFTILNGGSYTISATTPSSSLDTVIGVFAANGQRLAYNDDITSINTDSRLSFNLTAGSRYYLGVTNYRTTSRGSYSWSIDGPLVATAADDGYEENDAIGAAHNFGTLSGAHTVNQLRLADEDWFKFTTSATGTSIHSVSISFLNSQGNLQLRLFNSAGTLIASSLGTGNGESI
jgi:hypothetical protein